MHEILLRFVSRYIIYIVYLYITLLIAFQLINEVAKNNIFCVENNCSNYARHVIFRYNIVASINDEVDAEYLNTK